MLQICCTEKSGRYYKVTNYEVFRRAKETKCFLWQLKRRTQLIGHILGHDGLMETVIEGMIEGRNQREGLV